MSLLDAYMTPCVRLIKRMDVDEYGSAHIHWDDGNVIKAAIVLDDSTEARIAGVQGLTSVYKVTTSRTVDLQYHDVIRRMSDSKTFRVTSYGDDKMTPYTTALDMRQVSAEEWSVPT